MKRSSGKSGLVIEINQDFKRFIKSISNGETVSSPSEHEDEENSFIVDSEENSFIADSEETDEDDGGKSSSSEHEDEEESFVDSEEDDEGDEEVSPHSCMYCDERIIYEDLKNEEARECVINNPTGQLCYPGECESLLNKVGYLCPDCFDLGGDYDDCGGCGRASLGICVINRCRACFNQTQINDLLKKTWRFDCIVEMMNDKGVFELTDSGEIPYEFFGGEDGVTFPQNAHKIVEEALARELNQ